MIHELKTLKPYFQDVAIGVKTFEVREDDRKFQVGDYLLLNEIASDLRPTGRTISREIIYKLPGGEFGLAEGYCILGIR